MPKLPGLPTDASTQSESALFKSLGSGTLAIQNLFNVEGWVAIVTGGGTGLGLVTATALAENGAKVYITGRRLEPLEDASKGFKGRGEIIGVQADLSTKEGILKLRGEIEKKEKWVNVLINNHGVFEGMADITACEQTAEGISKAMFEGGEFERWASTYRINTASYYFTTFAFLPLLAAAKTQGQYDEPGNVLNLSSMSGITKTSQNGQMSYNAAKAATISLSNQLATEFGRRNLNIRVNVLCPGYFPSGMTVIPQDFNTGSEEHNKIFRKDWGIPLGRPGNAVDYAQSIFGLVTNRYITGAEVVIDGGWLLECAF